MTAPQWSRLARDIAGVVAASDLPEDTTRLPDEWDVGSKRDFTEYLADAFQTAAENLGWDFDRAAFVATAAGPIPDAPAEPEHDGSPIWWEGEQPPAGVTALQDIATGTVYVWEPTNDAWRRPSGGLVRTDYLRRVDVRVVPVEAPSLERVTADV